MNNTENEIKTLEKIADILDDAKLTLSAQLGLLDVLKHSLIQAAMNNGKNQ